MTSTARVINLSRHEVSEPQLAELAALVEIPVESLRLHQLNGTDRALLQLDLRQALGPQLAAVVDALGIERAAWDQEALLVVAPDLGPAAAVAMAVIHGRARFPILVWRSGDPRGAGFHVTGAEDLRLVREQARRDSLT